MDLTKYDATSFSIDDSKLKIDETDEWAAKYNSIVRRDYGKIGVSLHHILPRKKFPQFKDDARNHCMCPIYLHWLAHYFLWKHDSSYANEFKFVYYYFRKHANWTLTEEEEKQLNKDCRRRKENEAK